MYSKFGNRLSYCWRDKSKEERHWRGGRFSIYSGSDLDKTIDRKASFEYWISKPVYLFGGGIEFGYGDEPFSFNLFLWPFSLYGEMDSKVLRRLRDRLCPKYQGREIRFVMSPKDSRDGIRWTLWMDDSTWSSTDPKWRRGHVNLADLLLGRRDMRWESIETVGVDIPMPERSYAATVEMRDHVSWRKRFPRLERRERCANIEIPGGIGLPGKGENGWDIDDDAVFAMSCGARTVADAIGNVVASVYRDRKRHGGSYTFTPRNSEEIR